MSEHPNPSLWADIIPRDKLSRQYMWQVTKATAPFMVIALAAFVVDSLTPHFPIEIGVTAYEIGGGVLGVLLVLRTNSGYERWWEARKLWGGITNQSRSIATAAVAYAQDEAWKSEIIRWTILFAHATRRRLRNDSDLPEAPRLVGSEEALVLSRTAHPPLMIALRIARLLKAGEDQHLLPPAVLMQMERERISLLDHLGGCERILKTPLPRSYNIVMRLFLFVFLAAFPFGILQKATWLTPLLTAFAAFPMLALDEIGTELQNPFTTAYVNHLPLDEICTTIEQNLMELLPKQGRS